MVLPGRWQSKTLLTIEERGSKTARKSVFDCHLSPASDKWQSKTLFLMISYLCSLIVLTFLIATYRCDGLNLSSDRFSLSLRGGAPYSTITKSKITKA